LSQHGKGEGEVTRRNQTPDAYASIGPLLSEESKNQEGCILVVRRPRSTDKLSLLALVVFVRKTPTSYPSEEQRTGAAIRSSYILLVDEEDDHYC